MALQSLASGNDKDKAAIVAAGRIPPLVVLLSKGSEEGRAEAALALRNNACGHTANKAAVVAAGVIPLLVDLLSFGSDDGRVMAAGALRNLVCGKKAFKTAILRAGVILQLVELLCSDFDKVAASDGCGGAGDPHGRSRRQQGCVVEASAISPLVDLLRNGFDESREYAVGALWNLACGNNDIVGAVVAAGTLPPLV